MGALPCSSLKCNIVPLVKGGLVGGIGRRIENTKTPFDKNSYINTSNNEASASQNNFFGERASLEC